MQKWKFLLLEMDITCDSNHPHMPLMPTGKDLGKSLSWVDTSLSLVETVMTGGARGGMMSGGCV